MFGELLRLRGKVYETSGEFYRAQLAYTHAVNNGRPAAEVRAAAEAALETVKPCESALEALLRYLLTSEGARHRNQEVMLTLRLLALLYCEEESWLHLVEHASSWEQVLRNKQVGAEAGYRRPHAARDRAA
jgi:hypothetical protein